MMNRLHFFEAIERKVDFQKEYIKLEELCSKEYYGSYLSNGISINTWIEDNFWSWKKRSNYTSFKELRNQLEFSINDKNGNTSLMLQSVDINKYLLFCEMMYNLISDLFDKRNPGLDNVISAFFNTVRATLVKIGMETKTVDSEIIIVEKNAVAIEVAEIQPNLADIVIEYNHYLLKGNLDRKKEILKKLADALEPQKKILKEINKRVEDDFFYLVNSMNIRHNNSDPEDAAHYNHKFTIMTDSEKEIWYDLIYEQGLALFVYLEQKKRNNIIDEYKHAVCNN